jgi:hypothetical protein
LEPIGFRIADSEGMGGPVLERFLNFYHRVRTRWGDRAAAPLFPLALPLIYLDPRRLDCPYSLYVKAVKPAGAPATNGHAAAQ